MISVGVVKWLRSSPFSLRTENIDARNIGVLSQDGAVCIGDRSLGRVETSDVLLIKPVNDLGSRHIPLGLLHIGTVLQKAGYNVKIVDATRDTNYRDVIAKAAKSALLVGITCLTTEIRSAIEISDYIKSISNVPIIWGGWHPSLLPEQTCSDKSVDFVCIGEGEDMIVRLADALRNGSPLEGIEGLGYKDGPHVRVNPQRKYVNLEGLPPVNYDLVDVSQYLDTDVSGRKAIQYESSRGCPYRCRFCTNVVGGNQKYRAKTARKVIEEIEILIRLYKVNFIVFVDSNFFVSLKRVEEICAKMLQNSLNIKWFGECRADYFPRFTPEFLDLLARSGLAGLTIGAESGSQRILDLFQKDITVEEILLSAKMLSKYDIEPSYGFIVGTPWETKEDITMSIKVVRKIRELCPRAGYGFSVLTPYPKSAIAKELIEAGFLKEPQTLREWTGEMARRSYTGFAGSHSAKPWNRNPDFLARLSYYSGLAYNTYSNSDIVGYFKRLDFKIYPDLLCILAARLRMKFVFFGLPIDQVLLEKFREMRGRVGYYLQKGKSYGSS